MLCRLSATKGNRSTNLLSFLLLARITNRSKNAVMRWVIQAGSTSLYLYLFAGHPVQDRGYPGCRGLDPQRLRTASASGPSALGRLTAQSCRTSAPKLPDRLTDWEGWFVMFVRGGRAPKHSKTGPLKIIRLNLWTPRRCQTVALLVLSDLFLMPDGSGERAVSHR